MKQREFLFEGDLVELQVKINFAISRFKGGCELVDISSKRGYGSALVTITKEPPPLSFFCNVNDFEKWFLEKADCVFYPSSENYYIANPRFTNKK